MTALEYMEKQLSKHRLNVHREWERGAPEDVLNNIRQKIEHYKAAADALEKQPRWISVEERLPEQRDAYLAATTDGDVYDAEFIPSVKQWWIDDDLRLDVTHWMPLPEPPEEEV